MDRSSRGITVPRRFTASGADPFASFRFVQRTSRIANPDGSVVFEMDDVEVPDFWDQVAVDILASKYFRKTGVPLEAEPLPFEGDDAPPRTGSEHSVKQVAMRLANAWRIWGERGNYFATDADAETFRDEMAYMIVAQMAAPNTPAWFNVGQFEAYGIIQEPEGNWYWDAETGEVRLSEHRYERAAVNACFISAVGDQLVGEGSIFEFIENEARLFKAGSGSGANFSNIRGKGEKLSAGGTSSGVMSFLRVADRAAGSIKSGGATRRAAKMVILDADHPEIEDFVWCKVREEEKVAALVAGGYSSAFEGEAYETVSFQNGNNSVRVSTEFMQAVAEDAEWHLTARTSGEILRTVRARDLWHDIAEAAWRCADPGVQFDGTLNDWNTVADTERVRGTNPCFTGDTRVHTDRGLIRFDDLLSRAQAGETFRVYTHNATSETAPSTSVELSSPEAYMVTGVNAVVKLKFSNGAELRCTPNHRIWTDNRGYVRADELGADDEVQVLDVAAPSTMGSYEFAMSADARVTPGELIKSRYLSKRVETQLPGKWSDDFAHLCGWLLGDGCISLHQPGTSANYATTALVYGGAEEQSEILPQHRTTLEAITGGPVNSAEMGNDTVQLRVNRRPLVDFLLGLGFSTARAHDKRVPHALFEAPTEIIGAFLRGLFDADGTVVNSEAKASRYVGLGSTSAELLRDVQMLLSTFGITARIYETGKGSDEAFSYTTVSGEHRTYASRPGYDLRITGPSMVSFSAAIGFSVPSKATKLAKVAQGGPRGFYTKKSAVSLKERVDDGFEVTYNLCEPKNHSYIAGGIVVANCSEYTHVDDTACNLASLNLVKFYDAENRSFDVETFEHAVRLWTITLEINVSMSHYPSAEIARKSFQHRTLGLGYANLGALLMRAGLAYDSAPARAAMGAITALLHDRAYATSAELAEAVGACAAWEANASSMSRVLRNHRRAAYGSLADARSVPAYEGLTVVPQGVDHLALAHTPFVSLSESVLAAADAMMAGVDSGVGYRNAQVSVLAPTGCLTADTMVTTDHGVVRLGSLGDPDGEQWQDPTVPGLRVLTDDGPQAVSQFYVNGFAEVVKVLTEQGRRLRGTPEHRIKIVDSKTGQWRWSRLADLSGGDLVPVAPSLIGAPRRVALPPAEDMYWNGVDHWRYVPDVMTPELAELVGYFQGDGSLHAKGLRLAVCAEDEDVIKHLCRLSREVLGIEPDRADRGGYVSVNIHSIRLARWWAACGLGKAMPSPGHTGKGYTARVPDAVLGTNDPEIYAAFLRGLFEADGTIGTSAALSSASEPFTADVRTLLTSLGILTGSGETVGGISGKPVYKVVIRGGRHVERFTELVGFISRRKHTHLVATAAATSTTKRDWVPVPRSLLDELVPRNHHTRPAPRALLSEIRRQILAHQLRLGGVRVPRQVAEALYRETGDPRVGKLLDFFYDAVVSAELDGEALTYDLSVPANVTYVANGLVSHNTIGLVMSCDTTGVEPDFALVKLKKLAGGGYMRIVNSSLPPALTALGYDDEARDRIITHALGTQTLHGDTPVSVASLRAAGLPRPAIEAAAKALANVSDLTWAFARHTVGNDAYASYGVESDDGADLLAALGFSPDEVEASSKTICGHLTVEGAPDLRPEHYAVFDCAVECGDGTRVIDWSGHVKALAAVAPHISGSVSKTVNMPHSVSVDDVMDAYQLAYDLGVKCVAIYRDGSKLSQPLNSAKTGSAALDDESDAWALPVEIPVGVSPTEWYRGANPPRFRLPAMRHGMTWRLEVGGEEVYLRSGEYLTTDGAGDSIGDGTLGEVFIDWGKQGSTLRGITSALSIMLSQALQHGVPLERIVDALRGHTFEPYGVVRGHDNVKMASSLVDAVVRVLGHYYLGRDDLVQVPGGAVAPSARTGRGFTARPAALPAAGLAAPTAPESPTPDSSGEEATPAPAGKRVYDKTCSKCGGSNLIQAGSCAVCGDCGETTGCS